MQPPAATNGANWETGNRPFREGANPKHVALIGASVRSAAESARHAGWNVTGVDQFADQDTLHACNRHVLLSVDRQHREQLDPAVHAMVSLIGTEVPLIPVGGLCGAARLLDGLPLLSAWPEQRSATLQVRDLDYLGELTRMTPFSVPPTIRSSDLNADWPANVSNQSRWLGKSNDRSGGLGTRWLGDLSEASRHDVLQQWVPGRLFGATFIGNGETSRLLGVCRSLFTRKGPYPFVYCGSLGPIDVTEALARGLEDLGRAVVASSGLRGLFNLDFVAQDDGRLWLLEINPRWSGSSELVERRMRCLQPEFSLLSLMIDGLCGSPLSLPLNLPLGGESDVANDQPVYLKRIVFARCDHRFDARVVQKRLRPTETLHDIPEAGRRIGRGEPVCTLIRKFERPQTFSRPSHCRRDDNAMRRHRTLVRALSRANIARQSAVVGER